MHFSTLATVAFSAAASAKIINVSVGPNGGLTIEPSTIQAEAGDSVDFTFVAGNHGLSSADFDNPCQPPANGGGFWTDFQKVADVGVVTFRVPINDTNPIWLYCAQKVADHCQSGMVAVINPPSGKTVDDFSNAALMAPSSTWPPAPFGGFLVDASSSGDSTTTAPGSTAAPTASAAPTDATGSSSAEASSTEASSTEASSTSTEASSTSSTEASSTSSTKASSTEASSTEASSTKASSTAASNTVASSTEASGTGAPGTGAPSSSRPTAAAGSGIAPIHPNGAGSMSRMGGVALAALGMAVTLIA